MASLSNLFSGRKPVMVDEKSVLRFMKLFSGYSQAYGQFEQRKLNERAKMTGRSYTERKELGYDKYDVHLNKPGGPTLGVVMLRDDETCLFGAIDADDPATDHADLETRVRLHDLPLVVCRSKSGGAHLYCFTMEPTPAGTLKRKLSEWAALLGYSAKTEIFPKQTSRANEDDVGNWINLPYAAGSKRTAFHEAKEVWLEAFLDIAESKRVSLVDLEQVKYGRGKETDEYYEGPPCLQHLLAEGGFAMGTMRDGMFSVGVYLRKRYPDEWEDKLGQYNTRMCSPPLRNDEVQEIIKSLKKKGYGYKCKIPPLMEHCQRSTCTSRKFGVGDDGPSANGLEISAITCYMVEDTDDPPMWGMEIGGKRIMVDNATFLSAEKFNEKCLGSIRRVPIHVPPNRWKKMVDELAANSDVVYTPKEASETGNLMEKIQEYINGARLTAIDQVATGGAFKEEGFVYFRIASLFDHLESRRINYKSKPHVYHLLKSNFKGEVHSIVTTKGGFKVWKIAVITLTDAKPATPDFKQRTPF